MNRDIHARLSAGEAGTLVLQGQALWQLTGPDAERYLNGQVTQDVSLLPQDVARLAAVCTAKGRMEGACCIAAHGGAFFLDAEPVLRETLGPRLEKYLIADDAQLEDVTEGWSLSHIFGAVTPAAPEGGLVVKHSRFGLAGHDVWVPGATPFTTGIALEDEMAETIRIEHGIPRWGAELTAQTLPPEGGPVMLGGISYTKGCYVGQETIARLKSVGHVNRTLVFLTSATPAFPTVGAKLATAEKEIGIVTSSTFSPRLAAGIALGYVPTALSAPGTELRGADLVLQVAEPAPVEGTA